MDENYDDPIIVGEEEDGTEDREQGIAVEKEELDSEGTLYGKNVSLFFFWIFEFFFYFSTNKMA